MADMTPAASTAKGRYSQLETLRQPFLDRARDCAKVTLPYLIPPIGHTSVSRLYTPYQSLGSRGVNNLASKLLLTLLPPNTPFFKFSISDVAMEELAARKGAEAAKGAIDSALAKYERTVQDEIEANAYRVAMFPALKHLIVGGNVLIYMQPKGGIRMFALQSYVVKRDTSGNVIEIVIKEMVSPTALPDNVRALLPDHDSKSPQNDAELYTWVTREGNSWKSHQEINDLPIPGTEGTYPLDKSPYMALRWAVIDGEDYGRGYVEEYVGDLFSLEGLSQAIVEGSAAAAKVIIMVKAGAAVTQRQIAKANSGAVLTGNIDDVGVLQLEKYADFRVAKDVISEISQRLAYAFLLNTAIQRQGERVTAEEIRYMARELEDALGGVYSVLSQEFQMHFVQRLVYQMERGKKLPTMPKGFVKPQIVTGIEALGRGHDLQKLQAFFAAATQAFGPEVVAQRINVGDGLDRLAAAVGVNTDGLIKSQQQIDAEAAQAQQAQLASQAIGPGINAMGGVAKEAAAAAGQAATSMGGEAPEAPPQ